MQPVLTPLQWSIEDITVSSHRGLRTIKTCVSEWRGYLGRSSWFCRLFNYFRRNIISQKDFVILLPGRGGMVQSVETLHRSHCLHLCIPLCLCERNIFHKCCLSCITTHISTWMTVLTRGWSYTTAGYTITTCHYMHLVIVCSPNKRCFCCFWIFKKIFYAGVNSKMKPHKYQAGFWM